MERLVDNGSRGLLSSAGLASMCVSRQATVSVMNATSHVRFPNLSWNKEDATSFAVAGKRDRWKLGERKKPLRLKMFLYVRFSSEQAS